MEQRPPGPKGGTGELSRVPEVDRSNRRSDDIGLDVHPVHGAYGETVCVISLKERPRPLSTQVRPRVPDEGVVPYRQTGIGVVVAPDDVVGLREIIPYNLLVATRNLTNSIVHGRVPLHLLPDSLGAACLHEGQ